MNKLEVGMYVRTNIGMIDIIRTDLIGFDEAIGEKNVFCEKHIIEKARIVKASHNIIDLIELGDLVKIEFEKDDTNVFEVVAIDKINNEIGIFNNNFEFDWVGIEQLKSIVTKEQFSSMEYKVGGNNE